MFAPLYRSLIVIKIYQKVTPISLLLHVQTGSQSLIFKTNHISTTATGKFTIFAPLHRSLIVKKYLQRVDPNLTFTSCPNRKSKFNIKKKSYLNNHKK